MKLPAGTQGGVILDPRMRIWLSTSGHSKGYYKIDTGRGKGFLLMRNGELVAAYFEDKDGVYRGDTAVHDHGHPGE